MKQNVYDPDDDIAALATPWAESALAVVRTSGQGSIQKITELFSGKHPLSLARGHTLHRGYLHNPKSGEKIDDVIAAVYRGPSSYTGQDSVELFCHGSLPGLKRILELLYSSGFRKARPGEFTLRAFLNGKMDLTQAEAVNEVVSSKSVQAQSLALNRLSGALFSRISEVKKFIAELLAGIEIQLDYPEEDAETHAIPISLVREARRKLEDLLATYSTGRIFQEGIKVAIAGKTNAGKSSLFNLFLKEDRSIVSEMHGTTRDYIEAWITVEGIPVRLFDTAGLRDAQHEVEAEGIRRTQMILEQSQLILYVVDACRGVSHEDEKFVGLYGKGKPLIAVWNKVDVCDTTIPEGYIPVSAATGKGIAELERRIVQRVLGNARVSTGDVVIDSLRQKELLERCIESLVHVERGAERGIPLDAIALDVQETLNALAEITGEVTRDDILHIMFSKFCVGK